MCTDPIFRRQALRAAAQIREHLAGPGQLSPLPNLYESDWKELTQNVRRFDFVRERGWKSAAESLICDIDCCAMRLRRQLEDFKSQLPRGTQEGQVATAGEIAADLLALHAEFEDLELDLLEKTIRVLTLPIELEETYLGPFRIVLTWGKIGRGGPCYEVLADDPHSASDNHEVTHPHVMNGRLCEGDGAAAIRSSLAQGRLLDFFTLVQQILETYNDGSAYVALSRWNGGDECCDCGYSMSPDDSWGCVRCSETVCDNCRSTCQECDETLCSGCSVSCGQCDSTFCRRCLQSHPKTQVLICHACLEEGEPLDDEEPAETTPGESPAESESDASPLTADPLCLEEAALPA